MSCHPIWWVLGIGVGLLVANLLLIRADRRARGTRRPRLRWPAVRIGLCLLLVAIGVRPVIGHAVPQAAVSTGGDVVIMIDRTASMGSQDYNGSDTRISGVASDVSELVGELQGSRFTVIAIDNDARVEVPFTTDSASVASYASAIGWRSAEQGSGSDISVGVDAAVQVLQQSRADRPDAQRLFVYCGDGEQIGASPPRSFAPLRPYLTDALVLGYGTTSGGYMKTYPGSDAWIMYDGQRAVSHIGEANLKAIAEQTGGQYSHRTAPGPLPSTRMTVSHGEGQVTGRTPAELYWVFGLAAAVLLGAELWNALGDYRTTRRELS